MAQKQSLSLTARLISAGVAINMALGFIVKALALPVYIDSVGTIIVTLSTGLVPGIIAGTLSFLIGGLLYNPVLPAFIGTQVVIALWTNLLASRGMYSTWPKRTFSGLSLGIVAAIVSAPVIVYVFGGITGSGRSLITAALLASGQQIVKSVVYSGLASEPLDKLIQTVLAASAITSMPAGFMASFPGKYLKKNFHSDGK